MAAANDQRKYAVGDVVRILSIPDALVANLSESERAGILDCVGKEMTISEIDKWGGIWVGFGHIVEDGGDATYSGQSFIVDPDRVELVREVSQ